MSVTAQITTIWSEDFSSYIGGETIGADNNTNDVGADWSRTTSGIGNAKVRNNTATAPVFSANNVGAIGTKWSSEIIDITGFLNVSLSLFFQENGYDNANDNMKVYYELDNSGTEILFPSNGVLSGNVGSATANASGLTGTSVEIHVYFVDNADGNDKGRIDNIFVKGDNITPGGVDGLSLWLKADADVTGTTTVTQWDDQSGNDYHAVRNGTDLVPSYVDGTNANASNYNSTLLYTAAEEKLQLPVGFSPNLNGEFTVFTTAKSNFSGGSSRVFGPYSGGTFGISLELNIHPFVLVRTGASSLVPNNDWTYEGKVHTGVGTKSSTQWVSTVDGGTPVISSTNLSNFTFLSEYALGESTYNGAASFSFQGGLHEFIVYDDVISAGDKQRIESYLAIKYGSTLDNSAGGTAGDYTATDGTIIWDASVNAAYHNDVIGIGRDDIEGLLQKQSKTTNDSIRLFINTLATDNASNAGTVLNDKSYIVIGDNGEEMMANTTPSTEAPVGIYSRIDREWKITNTNFSEDYSIEIELSTTASVTLSDLRLLVDDDGDFTNATIINSPDVTFSFGSIIISGIGTAEIPMNSTKYITLASVVSSTPLPVELVSFDVSVSKEKDVGISWQTASEINNDYFTIERSTDGINWRALTTINATGNSTEILNYFEQDLQPYSGVSYYRLKQTDFNGEYKYSVAKAVNIERESKNISIYPNPFVDDLTIELVGDELKEIKILNTFGQDVSQYAKAIQRDKTKITVKLSGLKRGVYIVNVTSSDGTRYKEVILKD